MTLPAPLPPWPRKETLFLLDLNCWVHRFWAMVQGRAAHCFADFVASILRTYEPCYFAACKDVPFPTFRHELAPRVYKAHRDPPDPTLLERLRWSAEMLDDALGIPVFGRKGYEADDLLAALTKQAKDRGMHVVILAFDKDLMQLVDDRCIMWDGKNGIVGPKEVEAKFGVRPDQLRDYLAIVGDVSDNVPGIKGMGPRAAKELLQEFGSLDAAMLSAKAEGEVSMFPLFRQRPRYPALLREAEQQAALSQKLVTLAYDAPASLAAVPARA